MLTSQPFQSYYTSCTVSHIHHIPGSNACGNCVCNIVASFMPFSQSSTAPVAAAVPFLSKTPYKFYWSTSTGILPL